MMSRYFSLLLFVTAIATSAQAAAETDQHLRFRANDAAARSANNNVFVEIGGNAGLYSINYERYLHDDLTARIGAGYFALGASLGEAEANASLLLVPATLSYVGFRKGNHALEIGGGALVVHASAAASTLGEVFSESGTTAVGTATVGYRYVPKDGGLTFRAGYTPLFTSDDYVSWAGMSLGYSF